MAATLLSAQTPKGPYIVGAPSAGALALTFAACDPSNGNKFAVTGHELLVLNNTDTGPHNVTITSQPDSRGRTQDISAYAIGAGLFAMFAFLGSTEGWADAGGFVTFTAADATVKAAVVTVAR